MSSTKAKTRRGPKKARTRGSQRAGNPPEASLWLEADEAWKRTSRDGGEGGESVPEDRNGAGAPGMNSRPERPRSRQASREALRQVGREVLESALEPEAWAQALAESRGTHDDALALYSRIRCRNLIKSQLEQQDKARDLESRRRESFRDFRALPVAKAPLLPGHARGLRGMLDSVFWHLLAAAGTAGCLLAVRILWPGPFAHVPDPIVVMAVVAMQLIPLAGWWAGSGPRGAVTYPGIAQLTACVALIGSLVLGVKLLGSGDRYTVDRSPPPALPRQSPGRPAPEADPEEAKPVGLVVRSEPEGANGLD